MQLKRKLLSSVIQLVTCALIVFGTAAAVQAETKVDPSGTWQWVAEGRNGGPSRTNTLVLKVEGEKLTGTLTTPGRNNTNVDTKIDDATLKGDEISFSITREFNGNKIVAKYTGKVTADSIKGKIEGKNRNGDAQSRDWEAKKK